MPQPDYRANDLMERALDDARLREAIKEAAEALLRDEAIDEHELAQVVEHVLDSLKREMCDPTPDAMDARKDELERTGS